MSKLYWMKNGAICSGTVIGYDYNKKTFQVADDHDKTEVINVNMRHIDNNGSGYFTSKMRVLDVEVQRLTMNISDHRANAREQNRMADRCAARKVQWLNLLKTIDEGPTNGIEWFEQYAKEHTPAQVETEAKAKVRADYVRHTEPLTFGDWSSFIHTQGWSTNPVSFSFVPRNNPPTEESQ